MYEVIKINCENGEETNCGTHKNNADVEALVKGHNVIFERKNGFIGAFYNRKNDNFLFKVTEK